MRPGPIILIILLRVESIVGKVAIVTGGSRGIGRAIARALLERGMHVVITGTNERALVDAADGLRPSAAQGAQIQPIAADVKDYPAVERMTQAAVSRFGGIDVLVNNAGVGIYRLVTDMSLDEWHTVVDTNLTGVFHCCRAALPRLRQRGGGWIVNISSLSATGPFAGGAAYCASKAGLIAFSDALMQEVRHEGIRVSTVLPGSVNTGFAGHAVPEGDWKLSPDDVAQAVTDVIAYPARTLPSRVELRPSRPPKKG